MKVMYTVTFISKKYVNNMWFAYFKVKISNIWQSVKNNFKNDAQFKILMSLHISKHLNTLSDIPS